MGAKRVTKAGKSNTSAGEMKPISQQVAKAHKTVIKKISHATTAPVHTIDRCASTTKKAEEMSGRSSGCNYWLFKSEPSEYAISDLREDSGKPKCWDGVRNAQAKNYMKTMKLGDKAFFYHSNNGKDTGIVGIASISREAYPDHTSFDKSSKYYDAKTSSENPKWFMVDLALEEIWQKPVLLHSLKSLLSDASNKEAQVALGGMPLLQKGSRLSIQPVSSQQWEFIVNYSENNTK